MSHTPIPNYWAHDAHGSLVLVRAADYAHSSLIVQRVWDGHILHIGLAALQTGTTQDERDRGRAAQQMLDREWSVWMKGMLCHANDPGHSHSINDPGHSHSISISGGAGGAGAINPQAAQSPYPPMYQVGDELMIQQINRDPVPVKAKVVRVDAAVNIQSLPLYYVQVDNELGQRAITATSILYRCDPPLNASRAPTPVWNGSFPKSVAQGVMYGNRPLGPEDDPSPVDEETVEPHIMGLSPEVIDKDAYASFMRDL